MKRISIPVVLFILGCFFLKPAFAIENKAVKELTEMSEMRIDIGRAALIMAKEVYPDLDIELYSKDIDRMVGNVRRITKGSKDPEYRVRALNTYFYQMEKIQYDMSDPNAEKLDNRYLNGILRTKKGSCVTMPLLYLAVAQRLGYPIFPVAAPRHLFLRYVDPNFKENNIEATGGGGHSPDEEYIDVLQVSQEAIKSGSYMRTMSYREFLGDLLAENGVYWARKGNFKNAIDYLIQSVKLNPKSADNLRSLGTTHILLSRRTKGRLASGHIKFANQFLKKAEDMGVSRLSNKNYMSEQKKRQKAHRKKLVSQKGQ